LILIKSKREFLKKRKEWVESLEMRRAMKSKNHWRILRKNMRMDLMSRRNKIITRLTTKTNLTKWFQSNRRMIVDSKLLRELMSPRISMMKEKIKI
jgi:hypothetical protein